MDRMTDGRPKRPIENAAAPVRERGEDGDPRSQRGKVGTRSIYTIGREAFAKFSAVEGLVETPEARQRRRDFDRRGLTAAERRAAIIEAHRPR